MLNLLKAKLKKKTKNQPWFTKECRKKRALLYSAKHKHIKLRSEGSKHRVKTQSKQFKREIQKAVKDFNKAVHKKLRALKSSNPKEYWAILNNDKQKLSRIATEVLFDHFKKLNQASTDTDINDTSTEGNEQPEIQDDSPFNQPFVFDEIRKLTLKLKKMGKLVVWTP